MLAAPHLKWLSLEGNQLGGQPPWESLLQPKLRVLTLSRNSFEGEIGVRLPKTLQTLTLDNNRFQGDMPDFAHMEALSTLTAHSNSFVGRVHLPESGARLRALFLHNNRALSCEISGGSVLMARSEASESAR